MMLDKDVFNFRPEISLEWLEKVIYDVCSLRGGEASAIFIAKMIALLSNDEKIAEFKDNLLTRFKENNYPLSVSWLFDAHKNITDSVVIKLDSDVELVVSSARYTGPILLDKFVDQFKYDLVFAYLGSVPLQLHNNENE